MSHHGRSPSPAMASVIAAMFVLIAACSPTGAVGSSTSAASTTSTGATSTSTPDNGTTTPPVTEPAPAISIGETPLGAILVDPTGRSMYVLLNDDGESTCYDTCASSWPHVPADTPIGSGLDGSLFGSIIRTDGSEQLTIDGRPLYVFAGDQAPGDVQGQGLNDVWFVVAADGSPVQGSAGSSPPDDDDGGYGY